VDGTRVTVAVPLGDAIAYAVADMSATWVSTEQAARVAVLLERFELFCSAGFDVGDLMDITPSIAERFMWALDSDGGTPSLSIVRLRRFAIRLLFRCARGRGDAVGDPTLDLALPPRSDRRARPLTDDEVALCRSAAAWSLSDTRHASAWALAEATCRTGELPFITATDVDFDTHRVWLHGGRRTKPRWGELTEWGLVQLECRVGHITRRKAETPLAYAGSQTREGGRVSTSLALLDVLRRAGLSDEPDVRPSSITAWAGRRVLDATSRIDDAARALGFARLDQTAEFIGWDWRAED